MARSATPSWCRRSPRPIRVRVRRGANGLSPAQRAELIDFASHYRTTDAGNSRLVIAAPSGGANEVSAMYAVSEVRSLLYDQGFSEAAISVEAYDAEGSRSRRSASPICATWRSRPRAAIGRPISPTSPRTFPIPTSRAPVSTTSVPWLPTPPICWGRAARRARSSERRDQVWGKYVNGLPTGATKAAGRAGEQGQQQLRFN